MNFTATIQDAFSIFDNRNNSSAVGSVYAADVFRRGVDFESFKENYDTFTVVKTR